MTTHIFRHFCDVIVRIPTLCRRQKSGYRDTSHGKSMILLVFYQIVSIVTSYVDNPIPISLFCRQKVDIVNEDYCELTLTSRRFDSSTTGIYKVKPIVICVAFNFTYRCEVAFYDVIIIFIYYMTQLYVATGKVFVLQQKPLNVITLGQTKSDNINRMITITGCFYLVSFTKWDCET